MDSHLSSDPRDNGQPGTRLGPGHVAISEDRFDNKAHGTIVSAGQVDTHRGGPQGAMENNIRAGGELKGLPQKAWHGSGTIVNSSELPNHDPTKEHQVSGTLVSAALLDDIDANKGGQPHQQQQAVNPLDPSVQVADGAYQMSDGRILIVQQGQKHVMTAQQYNQIIAEQQQWAAQQQQAAAQQRAQRPSLMQQALNTIRGR